MSLRSRSCPIVAWPVLATLMLAPPPAVGRPSLTVYTRDLGLVRESRTLVRTAARDTVRIPDLPERLDFPSVRLSPEGGARVTRLAYRWDVASGDGLIESARGRRVRVGSRGDRVTEGVLVAADAYWLVVRADDGSMSTVARTAVEVVRLANPPAGTSLRPTLEAVLEGGKAGATEAELTYLTGGLSWNAEHTLVRQGEGAATWSSAVTVENTTGRSWENADLKLVAGEPQREGPAPMPRAMGMEMKMNAAAAPADMSEQSFSEYHLYTLDRPVALRDRETQSFTLIAPRPIKVTPRYLYRGGDPRGVLSQVELVNSKGAGPGEPVPGGRVRFYQADASGALQFTGETRIAHTPEGEKRTLDMGVAFDLSAERREVSNKRITDRERELSVEIKLRNQKKVAATVMVEEPVGGDVEVLRNTHPFTRKDAGTLQFSVPVEPGKEVVVGYTVRVRY